MKNDPTKNRQRCLFALAASLVPFAISCSHAASRQVDEHLAQQPVPANRAALNSETDSLIQKAAISEEQRAQLVKIRDETRAKLDEDQRQSLHLRSALMQEVMNENFNPSQFNVIKTRMKTLENARLATIFQAVDEANRVLGHDRTELRRQYMHDIIRDPAEVSRATVF